MQVARRDVVDRGIAAVPFGSFATQFDNRNFETGDLSGWALSSTPLSGRFAQAVNSNAGITPLQGQYSALLITRDLFLNCLIDAWGVGCPTPIPFTSVQESAPPPYTVYLPWSVTLSQQVALRAGDVVSFDFARYSNESLFGDFGDLSFDAFFATLRTEPLAGSAEDTL